MSFLVGFSKTAKDSEWLYHGTTLKGLKAIRVHGIDPKYQGTGLGAPDKLDGYNVISYTRNPNVAKIYARGDKWWHTLIGKSSKPILVKVPLKKGTKEMTKRWTHHEVLSTAKIPNKDMVFHEDPRYQEIVDSMEDGN